LGEGTVDRRWHLDLERVEVLDAVADQYTACQDIAAEQALDVLSPERYLNHDELTGGVVTAR
jgi:hypothetical protein